MKTVLIVAILSLSLSTISFAQAGGGASGIPGNPARECGDKLSLCLSRVNDAYQECLNRGIKKDICDKVKDAGYELCFIEYVKCKIKDIFPKDKSAIELLLDNEQGVPNSKN